MSVSDILGTHVITNDWMNSDNNPDTNAPGHAGYGVLDMLRLAADAGSNVVRLPLTLQYVRLDANGNYFLPNWVITDMLAPLLQEAAARSATGQPLQIIFQLSDTPFNVAFTDIAAITNATKAFVDRVYTALPQYASNIAGWEFGNEPNEYSSGAYRNSPELYATYINSLANAISTIETQKNIPISVIAGGIVYNDETYMERFFASLGTNPNIDGFAIHPYTIPAQSEPTGLNTNPADLASKRPTDWTDPAAPSPVNDFQAALYTIQQLMNDNGHQNKSLWVTEIGVPSWLGARNAGADGRDDQARWIAETLGVTDSWGNANLKSIVFHTTLDFELGTVNDTYSVYDANPANNNNGMFGENAFGLFERMTAGGPVVAKAAAYVMRAMQGDMTLTSPLYTQDMQDVLTRLRIVVGQGEAGTHDLSTIAPASTTGLTSGYIVLAQGGNDTITGTSLDDSLFAGDGDDIANGGNGNDRIYGGSGADTLNGGEGNDDIYGNTGDDIINAGPGTNRVDGGTGSDTLVLAGTRADYVITGDGVHLTVTGLGQITDAYNIEKIRFLGDLSETTLANGDIRRGNGLIDPGDGAVNIPAVIGLPDNPSVTEDLNPVAGELRASGAISITDADGVAAFTGTAVKSNGTLGTLQIAASGTYVYSVANEAVQYLGEGKTKTESFLITALDGTTKTVDFTIIGRNDAAVIGVPTVSAVTEDSGVVSGNLVATGSLPVSDADTGEASFMPTAVAASGTLGSLIINADGTYRYSIANSAVQALNSGEAKTETFTVSTLDGTSRQISFTINGVNETNIAAVIGNPTVVALTEDTNVVQGLLTASGSISISDADAGQSSFLPLNLAASATKGSFSLAADGTYSYSFANSAAQSLRAGEIHTDTFTISALDGTTKDIAFTVTGVNDAATIGTPNVASVTEDVGLVNGNLVATGLIPVSDPDLGEAAFRPLVIAADGNLGALSLNPNGSYVYVVDNSLVQSLGTGQTKIDSFTVASLDGTSRTVSFTINGVNETNEAETLFQDVPQTQWLTGTSSRDVFVIDAPSSGYHAGRTLDGSGIVVWNGAKFDILTGFETLRFLDRDVKADGNGNFVIAPQDSTNYETRYIDTVEAQYLTGTSSNDVFVINASSANYYSGRTADGAIVVWNGAKFDVLTGFETLRFNDREFKANASGLFDIQGGGLPPAGETVVQNVAGTQYLTGTTAHDVFSLGESSASYGFGKTLDGSGIVVWKGADFDILTGFEVLRFTDLDVQVSSIV